MSPRNGRCGRRSPRHERAGKYDAAFTATRAAQGQPASAILLKRLDPRDVADGHRLRTHSPGGFAGPDTNMARFVASRFGNREPAKTSRFSGTTFSHCRRPLGGRGVDTAPFPPRNFCKRTVRSRAGVAATVLAAPNRVLD